MTDYTTLSDEELMKMAGIDGGATAPSAGADISKLSDEELMRMAGIADKHTATANMPWYKKMAKALALGASDTIKGYTNTSGKLGDTTGTSSPANARLAGLASSIEDGAGLSDYEPASVGMNDQSKSFKERMAYAPRAVLEAAPGLATDVGAFFAGGPLAAMANNAYRNAGNNIDSVRSADGSDANTTLTPAQMARVAAVTGGDALLSRVGIGSVASAPVKSVGLSGVGANIAKVIGAAGGSAIDAAGQTALDKGIVQGQLPTANDLAVSAATGGAVGGGIRTLHALPNAGEAIRFRQFEDADPRVLAGVAQRLKEQQDVYGRIREENAGRVLDTAREGLQSEARTNERLGGISKTLDDNFKAGLDEEGPFIFSKTKAELGAKQPVNPDNIRRLDEILKQEDSPQADNWVKNLREEDVLNRLGRLGARDGEAIRGGMHSADIAQKLKPFGRSPLVNIGEVLGLGALMGGHVTHLPWIGSVDPSTAATIAGGHIAGWAGLRGIDALTGQSNPVGRFAKRFAEPEGAPALGRPQMAADAAQDAPAPNQPSPFGGLLRGPEPIDVDYRDVTPPPAPPPGQYGSSPLDPKLLAINAGLKKAAEAKAAQAAKVEPEGPKFQTFDQEHGQYGASPLPTGQLRANLALKKAAEAKAAKAAKAEEEIKAAAAAKPTEETGDNPPNYLVVKASAEAKAKKAVSEAKRGDAKEDFVGPDGLITHTYKGVDASIHPNDIKRSVEGWRNGVENKADARHAATEEIKHLLPDALKPKADELFKKWMESGIRKNAAMSRLEDLATSEGVTPEVASKIYDIWMNNPTLNDASHWEGSK